VVALKQERVVLASTLRLVGVRHRDAIAKQQVRWRFEHIGLRTMPSSVNLPSHRDVDVQALECQSVIKVLQIHRFMYLVA